MKAGTMHAGTAKLQRLRAAAPSPSQLVPSHASHMQQSGAAASLLCLVDEPEAQSSLSRSGVDCRSWCEILWLCLMVGDPLQAYPPGMYVALPAAPGSPTLQHLPPRCTTPPITSPMQFPWGAPVPPGHPPCPPKLPNTAPGPTGGRPVSSQGMAPSRKLRWADDAPVGVWPAWLWWDASKQGGVGLWIASCKARLASRAVWHRVSTLHPYTTRQQAQQATPGIAMKPQEPRPSSCTAVSVYLPAQALVSRAWQGPHAWRYNILQLAAGWPVRLWQQQQQHHSAVTLPLMFTLSALHSISMSPVSQWQGTP